MRRITIFFAALVLAFVGYLLWSAEREELADEPYIVGTIYEIEDDRILVAEGISGEEYTGDIDDIIGNAGWFTVDENTEVTNDLEEGKRVSLWTVGPVMESYPVQATASRIEVEKEEVAEKECFVGGCSGEICSDDPEAISTCELLPGMECIDEEMSCELVEGECEWVMSEEAANCFMAVVEEEGEEVRGTRIGYLFDKAEETLK